jgi:L-threonylcarbamoyladenylate synthase
VTKILPYNEQKMPNLDEAVELLKSGDIIAFPTETVYGLGANAYNRLAVEKIFKIKGRPNDNPIIVHVDALENVYRLVSEEKLQNKALKKKLKLLPRFFGQDP